MSKHPPKSLAHRSGSTKKVNGARVHPVKGFPFGGGKRASWMQPSFEVGGQSAPTDSNPVRRHQIQARPRGGQS